MRLLVGAACVAVIAFVGYFFWGEYAKSQARAMEAQANKRQAFEDDCARVIVLNAKFDIEYAKSLTESERIDRVKRCKAFYDKGVLPD